MKKIIEIILFVGLNFYVFTLTFPTSSPLSKGWEWITQPFLAHPFLMIIKVLLFIVIMWFMNLGVVEFIDDFYFRKLRKAFTRKQAQQAQEVKKLLCNIRDDIIKKRDSNEM